jgi:hypothetical protein
MSEKFRREYQDTLEFFSSVALRSATIRTWADARVFLTGSAYPNWVYVVLFSDADWIYSFGTASNDGTRLKKTGLLQRKLTGKYDRRGDYLMLKAIYGSPVILLFEVEEAVKAEQERRSQIYSGNRKGACLRGFVCEDRDSITREIVRRFRSTNRYRNLQPHHARLFDEFIDGFYLAKLKHPHRNATFYYGDCMEPNFIGRTLGRIDIEEAVSIALDVEF